MQDIAVERHHPELTVQYRNRYDTACVSDVREGISDFAIVVTPENKSGLNCILLKSETVFHVVPLGHPLAQRSSLRIEDIWDFPLMINLNHDTSDPLFLERCKKQRFSPNIVYQAADIISYTSSVPRGRDSG